MGEILDSLQASYDFMINGSYNFVHEALGHMTMFIVKWYFMIKTWALKQLWFVGESMLDELNLSSLIRTYWGGLDSNLMGFLTRYRLPEAGNLILNSHITVWLWRMMT